MSLLVSEKKIVSSWAEKSMPTKYEGLPVTGMITSSWVERLNGIPRTASWDENSRNCCTAAKGKIRLSLYLFTKWDNWALITGKILFSFGNTNRLETGNKKEWENRNFNIHRSKNWRTKPNPEYQMMWSGIPLALLFWSYRSRNDFLCSPLYNHL